MTARALAPRRSFIALLVALAALLALAAAAAAQPIVVDPDWTLVRTIAFENPMAACYDPVDGQIYVGRRGGGGAGDGLYRINAFGLAALLAAGSNPAAVCVHPDSGSIFLTEDYGGVIYRTALGASGRTTWVSGFHSGDDDPIGMAIAPATYSGDVLLPGEALVVDRGYSGLDEIWIWSPLVAEGERLLHTDNGTLVDAVDVAIDDTGVYVVDSGDSQAGVVYEVTAGGVLVPLATSEPLDDPTGIAIDPWTGDLLVIEHLAGRVVRIDRTTGAVAELVTGLSATWGWAGIDLSPDGRRLVLTDRGENAIYVLARCDVTGAPDLDCDLNGVADLCDIALGAADDCNGNGVPDPCDLAGGTSEDCNLDGIPDDCPTCPPVEVVFIMDTSTSMDDEASALCGSMTAVVAQLAAAGLVVEPSLLGICDLPGGAYACLENHITALLGTIVPGSPPAGLETLGACPGGLEVCQEDWGLAPAVVAGAYPWQPDASSVRVIIPVTDEGSWCGDPVTPNDQAAVAHAIAIARANQVIVSPITGTGASAQVVALARALAASTGGQSFSSTTPALDIAEAIVDLVLDACAAFADCNQNGTLDECDLASGASQDANGNGIPDECEGPVGILEPLPRPAAVCLSQNVPNPFNPTTVIRFELPRPAPVDLSVFSLDGRRIVTLARGRHAAGRYEVVWNGRDGADRSLASGTYIYRLRAAGEVQSRRLVLLK